MSVTINHLITRKSHTGFRLVPTSMKLNDPELRNSPYFAFFSANSIALRGHYITVVEDRLIMSVKCLPVSGFHFWPNLMHPAAFAVPVENVRRRPWLRSPSTGCIYLPRVQTLISRRSFEFCERTMWNSLRDDKSVSVNMFGGCLELIFFGHRWAIWYSVMLMPSVNIFTYLFSYNVLNSIGLRTDSSNSRTIQAAWWTLLYTTSRLLPVTSNCVHKFRWCRWSNVWWPAQ